MVLKKRPTGRPSGYSEKIASIICARIADGESLRMICADDQMPGRRTVLDWLDDDRHIAFRARYARARENQADYLEEEMCDIERETLSGNLDPKAARVVLGSKQWRAEKLAPKKYGNRIAIGGADDLPPIKTMSDEALLSKIVELQNIIAAHHE